MIHDTTNDKLAKHHHPHFLYAKTQSVFDTPSYTFTFKPFTGYEPEPDGNAAWRKYHDDPALTSDDRQFLSIEYRAARIQWGRARFARRAQAMLREASPVWRDYLSARKEMDTLFGGFSHTTNGKWRARILQLTDAHELVRKQARRWDKVAERLARLQDEHLRTVGEEHETLLHEVARTLSPSMNIEDWEIGCLYEYERSPNSYGFVTPLVEKVEEEIERQRTSLAEVSNLAGDHITI